MPQSAAKPRTAAAAVNLADQALAGPQARAAYGVSGAGIKIGILSDSYNLNGTAGPPATILKEGPPGSGDEGRAMGQLIAATAPAAQLYFYSADYSEQDFANGITALVAAGCQVIVDDISWEDEPFFQLAGPIDQAVQAALAKGVDYVSAAGNQGNAFYQGAFIPLATTIPGIGNVTTAQFQGGAAYQSVVIPANVSVTLSLQWSAPYAAANAPTLSVAAVATDGSVIQSFQQGQEPTALLDFPVLAQSATYRIYIPLLAGAPAPAQFKYILQGGGAISAPGAGVGSGSIIGHDLVPGVNVAGAVNVAATPAEGGTPTPETFSGTGPGTLLYAANGAKLATPQTLNTPSFLAPDGASTTVFAPFLGTSAAAASAAAVIALMLQADPTLNHGDVSTLLADTAIPAGAASVAGAGLIQANTAVAAALTRDVSNSAQPLIIGLSVACTIGSGAGAHTIQGGAGPALLQSGGTDTVIAGSGADTVDLLGSAALLFGAAAPLDVRALNGADTVIGGAGSVTVAGGSGGGVEYGSASGDNYLVAGNRPTTLVQGGAADTLAAAGGGNDTLFGAGSGAATLLGGGSTGNVFVAGGSGADLILPGQGSNLVFLSSGADTVFGGAGAMVVQAGSGPQWVFGGAAGGNALLAGSGAATLVGGGANDTLAGNAAGDLLVAAAAGNATLFGSVANSGQETLVGGAAGVNIFVLRAADAVVAPEAATAVVALGSGQSTVVAGSGTDLINCVAGQTGGEDFITGFDPARDMLRLAGYGAGAAAAVSGQYDIAGNSWLTLPDGTVVAFVGLAHLSAANVVIA